MVALKNLLQCTLARRRITQPFLDMTGMPQPHASLPHRAVQQFEDVLDPLIYVDLDKPAMRTPP